MPRHATKTSFKSGEKHVFWKGGTSDFWRREARKITNCPKDMIVHHIDGNYENNNIDNLQIIKQSEHVAIHNKQRKGSIKPNSLKYKIKNYVIELTNLGYSSRKIARILNVGKTTVLRCRR